MTRAYWLLWTGLTVSRFGDGFLTIGVLWQIFAQTGSVLALGLTYAAYCAALAAGRAVLGPLADRHDRRRLMVALDSARAALTALPLALLLLHALPVWALAAVYAGTGVLGTPYDAAAMAALPRLVEDRSLARANSRLFGAAQVAHLVGPGIGGLVIALSGAPQAVALDGLSFLLCAACVAALPAGAGGGGGTVAADSYRRAVRAGWTEIRVRPTLGFIAALSATLWATDTTFVVLFVPLVATRLHGGAAGAGLLEASVSAGALVASWVAGTDGWRSRPFLVWASVPVFCLATAGLAVAPTMVWALALQALAGLLTGLYTIPARIVYQRTVADQVLGRALATRGAIVSAARSGGAVAAGSLALAFGVAATFGALGLAGAAAGAALLWAARRRDALAA